MSQQTDPDPQAALKRVAALEAVKHVEHGMWLGLGTGSTAQHAIHAIGERYRQGELKDIRAVATSRASEALARHYGLPLFDLEGQPLDLAIDGMDELDPQLDAIKGLGGALTREKIVEACAKRLILIADDSKRVTYLGERAPVPVEVVQFGWRATRAKLEALDLGPELRLAGGEPLITDNGNYILDARLSGPRDPRMLAEHLANTPGVVEHGLFLGMASLAYLATPAGVLELRREDS